MATTTSRKLRLIFKDASGNNVTQNWSNTKANVTRTAVKAFMSSLITNGAIFRNVPKSEVSATEITTTKDTFELA